MTKKEEGVKNTKKKKIVKEKKQLAFKDVAKKNLAFIIIYTIQIILSLIAYARLEKIIDNMVASMEELRDLLGSSIDPLIETYTSTTGRGMIAFFILCAVVLGCIGLYYALFDKLKEHKIYLIVSNAIAADEGLSLISPLYSLACVAGIVFSSILKREKITKEEKLALKKERVPKKFRQRKSTLDVYIKSGIIIVVYFALMFLPTYKLFPKVNGMVIGIVTYIILIALSIWFYYAEYKQMFASFKNFKHKLGYVLKKWGIMLAIYLPFSLVISLVFGTPENQEVVNSLNPFFSIVLATIYAPIVEETVFRGAIRKLITNDFVYIIVSAVSFGLIHTMGQEVTILYTLAKAVPYAIIGGYFAYVYTKNNNMMYNIAMHATHNFILSIPAIIGYLI